MAFLLVTGCHAHGVEWHVTLGNLERSEIKRSGVVFVGKMDKRRVLRALLVIAAIVGVVLLIVGGVLYWHYSKDESNKKPSPADANQVP